MMAGKKPKAASGSGSGGGAPKALFLVLAIIILGITLILDPARFGLTGPADPQAPANPQEPAVVAPSGHPAGPGVPGGSGPGWQVLFTDPATFPAPADPAVTVPSGSVLEHFISRIGKARSSIHLACFETDLTPIAQALIEAKKRGVQVVWITDGEYGLDADNEKGHGQFTALKDAGIEVIADTRSALMHTKFVIIDKKTVWTGATNLTVAGMYENNNNAIIFESEALASIYETEFAEMRAGEFGTKPTRAAENQQARIGSVDVSVRFSPEDKAMSRIIQLVEGAEKSVRIMAFSFTHDGLAQALLARAKAGVDCAAIFEKRGSETKSSELKALLAAGIPARQDGNPSTFHHKVIVVDGRWTMTGSLNFSANADETNNEDSLVIDSPEIASLYLAEFDRRWTEARVPELQQ